MSARGDVAPSTLGVELLDYGVEVEYLDGRATVYRGVPEAVTDSVITGPGKETHVLVTDPTETEGVMLYVNDLKTHDDILESSGAGRIILDDGESEEVFPGVTVSVAGHRTTVEADTDVARGRVFVFAEDDWTEQSYEIRNDEAERDEWAEDDAEETDESERENGETVDEDAIAAAVEGASTDDQTPPASDDAVGRGPTGDRNASRSGDAIDDGAGADGTDPGRDAR